MIKSCNLLVIQDKLIRHVARTSTFNCPKNFTYTLEQIQTLHMLVRNSHFDFSRAGGLDLAIELGDVNLVTFYVKRNLSPACIHGAIHIAAECGQTETLSILLSATKDPLESVILKKACKAGHTEVVKLLLKDGRIEPKSKHMEAACLNGNYAAAAHLVHAGTKLEDLHQLFREVCSKGFLPVAKLLLRCYRTDPTDSDNSALYRACHGGHYELAVHLLSLPDVSAAVQKEFE
jgi:ankyrin repeat protein